MKDRKLLAEARDHSYQCMLDAQYLMDRATTEEEKRIADYLYYAAWASYNLLVVMERKELKTC